MKIKILFLSVIVLYALAANGFAVTCKQPTVNHKFSLSENPFRYSDYYQDFESKMHYLRARYYSPKLARFISRDTYDLSNRHAYCDGDPAGNVDSDGHLSSSAWCQIGVAAAFLTGSLLMGNAGLLVGDILQTTGVICSIIGEERGGPCSLAGWGITMAGVGVSGCVGITEALAASKELNLCVLGRYNLFFLGKRETEPRILVVGCAVLS